MKIVINALSARRGGGQTYLVNLLSYLECIPDGQILILAPESLCLSDDPKITRLHTNLFVGIPFVRAIWEKFFLPILLKKVGADILFCPGGLINTKQPVGCKTVTMFRNMIPFDRDIRDRYPLGYMRVRNWLLERIMLKSMKKADLVIFISEFARNVIEERANKSRIKSVTIPHGLSSHFKLKDRVTLHQPDWLPKTDYFLYVSIFEVYKRHLEVLRGYDLYKRRHATEEKLILAGYDEMPYGDVVRKEIKNLGLENDVILPGNIPYNQLPAVYQHAKINIFASECENCPNILLEAMGAGRPTLVSNKMPMPEFGGDAVVYFDPASPEDFAEKLQSLTDNPLDMDIYADKARKRAELFDWETTAKDTWKAISSLLPK